MPENIPFDIQGEIIKSLPAKSLIRSRSVSKTWKSLIDSSSFIARYNGQVQHLLVTYHDDFKENFVSIADDHTFPQHKVTLTIPPLVKTLNYHRIIGCSHGLLCLYGFRLERRGGHTSTTYMAVLWNLSIRKAVAIVVPNVLHGINETVLGFGVCRETADPKIVKITQVNRWSDRETITSIPRQVEVFTLSTGAWRRPYSNLPRKSIIFQCLHVAIDGFLYWLGTDRITTDGGFRSCNLIISFDMTSEEFREVSLPDNLANQDCCILAISKLRRSLVVIECGEGAKYSGIGIWMMEDGVPNSFTKLFTVNAPHESVILAKGFRKTGELLFVTVQVRRGFFASISVYEPFSQSFNDLGINGRDYSYFVCPYMETLLLLDQPAYEKGNGKEES